MTKIIDQEIVCKLLRYDPETGKLFWRTRVAGGPITEIYARRFNSRFAGSEAFTSRTHAGYLQGHILSGKYAAHRVIWLIMHGEWPVEIDHINGDRSDNRRENLRAVTHTENCKNLAARKRRSGPATGVRFTKGAWQSSITSGGQRIYLGRFKNLNEAIHARKQAESHLGFHPNHGRNT